MITLLYVAFGITFIIGLRMFLMSLGGGYGAAPQRAWGLVLLGVAGILVAVGTALGV